MPRARREQHRARWLVPAALTLTVAVAAAGIYFWHEMEDHDASAGFRSEDEETNDERSRQRSRGMAGRGFGESAGATGSNIGSKVSEIWRNIFEGGSSDESDAGGRRRSGPPNMSGARSVDSGASGNVNSGGPPSRGGPTLVRSREATSPLGNSQLIDWDKKKIVAIVISSLEELEESLLLSLPTPLDISRWVVLILVYAPPPPPSPSLVQLSPRPIHRSPSPAISIKSYTSSKSFARTQGSPPLYSPETSPSLVPALRTPATSGRTSRADGVLIDEDDLLSAPSLSSTGRNRSGSKSKAYSSASEAEPGSRRYGSVRGKGKDKPRDPDLDLVPTSSDENSSTVTGPSDSNLPALILKTFGRDFPHQQVLHYSTPTGVVHMLRHLGVALVFLSESCASVPQNKETPDDEPAPPGAMPQSPPPQLPGTTPPVGGGEIVGMLKNWVGEIVLVLDEDEDDSAPIRPSAVSGGEDEYEMKRRRKQKERSKGVISEATGRKRRWLKDRTISKDITICDRQGLKGIWRAKVEGRP